VAKEKERERRKRNADSPYWEKTGFGSDSAFFSAKRQVHEKEMLSCCGEGRQEAEGSRLLDPEGAGVTKNRTIVVAGYSGVGKAPSQRCHTHTKREREREVGGGMTGNDGFLGAFPF